MPARWRKGGELPGHVVPAGIHKIRHVMFVMQENRSFDAYFGTYPGAAGIPVHNGMPAVYVPNPARRALGPTTTWPTSTAAARTAKPAWSPDVDGRKMDSFIRQRDRARIGCRNPDDLACADSGA